MSHPEGPSMLRRIVTGETLQEVGDSYGLTRERIRQIVTELDPDATHKGRAVRAAAWQVETRGMLTRVLAGETLDKVAAAYGISKDTARKAVLALDPDALAKSGRSRARTQGLRCAACWGPLPTLAPGQSIRRRRITVRLCSDRCRELWRLARYHLADSRYRDQHRESTAQWSAANEPEGPRATHGRNVLNGTARRYANPPGPTTPLTRHALAEIERLRAQHTQPANESSKHW